MRHNVKRYYLSHVGIASKTGDTQDGANYSEPAQILNLILQTADTPGIPRQIIVMFNRMQRIIRQLTELKNTNECSVQEGQETLKSRLEDVYGTAEKFKEFFGDYFGSIDDTANLADHVREMLETLIKCMTLYFPSTACAAFPEAGSFNESEAGEPLGTIVSTRRNSRDLSTGNQSKSAGGRAKSKTSENKRTEGGALSVHTGFRHERSQSIPKTVQNKPGTTQISPEQRQDFSKGTENKLKETQILPVDTEIKPEYTEFKAGKTGDKSTDTEIKPGDTDFFPGDTAFKPGDTESLPGDTGGKSVDTESSPVDVEIQPVDVENLLGDIQFSLEDIEIRLICCENLSENGREFSETTGEKSESSQNKPETGRGTSEYIEFIPRLFKIKLNYTYKCSDIHHIKKEKNALQPGVYGVVSIAAPTAGKCSLCTRRTAKSKQSIKYIGD